MDNFKIGKIRGAFIAFVMFALYGMVGTGDLKQAEETQAVYVDMVCMGLWPDYQNQKPDCEGES